MPGKHHKKNLLQKLLENLKRMASRQTNDQNGLQEILDQLKRPAKSSEMPHRIELCQKALAMISKESEPKKWGFLQNNLGLSLARTPVGARAENLEQAIHHFELALEVRTRKEDPKEWASVQNNLGTVYRDRICGERAENLEKAIEHYQAALEGRTSQDSPKDWALTQSNLAGVYYIRIQGERAENLEQAIQCYKKVLEVRTPEENKEEWAATQNNLANAYRDRIRDKRAENIQHAIYHYQQSLSVYTRKAFPEEWSSLQDSLGNAYSYRIHGDRSANIEQAIQYFQQALEVRTRAASPEDWAQTQNNLGNAYLMRIRGERAENVDKAIQHYEQALEVRTRAASPEDWARTRNSLGNAYLARIRGKRAEGVEDMKNIERAILSYKQALEVRTHAAFPEDWAETLNNLAGAERMDAPEDIEQSIQHLQQTLDVYTRQAFPQYWARAQNNLAMAYTDCTQGQRAENVDKAIQHYEQALEVYTPEAFSAHCLKTARGLGNLAFEEGRWELARKNYDLVFAAQEALMHASFSSASEKIELAEVQNLPPRAAYAHWKSGDIRRAVEVLEKGHAQLLRESYEYQRQNLKRLSSLGFKDLYDDYMRARDEYQALQTLETDKNIHLADWEHALEKVQAAAAAIRKVVGQKHPQYRYFLQSLSFTEIQEQALEKPLVYLCATAAGGLALIVSEQGARAIEIPELDQESLQKQIWRPSNEEIERLNAHLQLGFITPEDIQAVKGGFFSAYALWSLTSYMTHTSEELKLKLFATWQETLDDTTRWLWEMVMGDLVTTLKEHSASVTLIPAGQLALLPLHAAWTEDTSMPTHRRYALDELNISYVPSAHTLWRASRLVTERRSELLMAVDNPEPDNPDRALPAAEDEVISALSYFDRSTSRRLHGRDATIEAVKKEIQEAEVLHFAVHSHTGWREAKDARLELADGSYLALPEIFALDLNRARLAVLSACETGIPGMELVDEMIGLPSGMMQAGVPGVIGSLWFVKDVSTAMLMARFYRFWRKEGKSPQEALRQAQIWLRDRLYNSPYYWAAFTYTGV